MRTMEDNALTAIPAIISTSPSCTGIAVRLEVRQVGLDQLSAGATPCTPSKPKAHAVDAGLPLVVGMMGSVAAGEHRPKA